MRLATADDVTSDWLESDVDRADTWLATEIDRLETPLLMAEMADEVTTEALDTSDDRPVSEVATLATAPFTAAI